jgi:DNA-binding LacI/PurR family transcriptional regulator
MQAAMALDLRVPRDLSLVGYNGDAWGGLLPVPLTTIAQPRLEVGVLAAQRVLTQPAAEPPAQRVVLEPKLVVRASSAAPSA